MHQYVLSIHNEIIWDAGDAEKRQTNRDVFPFRTLRVDSRRSSIKKVDQAVDFSFIQEIVQ